MSHQEKALKKLPCGATKQQIYKMYPRESDQEIRSAIHYVQKKNNPHKTEEAAVRTHRLRFKEFKDFVELMGTPVGYSEEYNN